MLILPFAKNVVSAESVTIVTAEAVPPRPLYIDRFCIPISQWEVFTSLENVKVGKNGEPFDLMFAVLPESPHAAYAVLPKPLLLAAGDELSATITNITGASRALRMSALVFADEEIGISP